MIEQDRTLACRCTLLDVLHEARCADDCGLAKPSGDVSMKLKSCMTGIALAVFVAGAASPALAKARNHHRPLYLNSAPISSRDAALRECNAEVAPYNNRDFQGSQIIRYNACMFEHGQMP